MRDEEPARVLDGVPANFQAACASIFLVPAHETEDRLFLCRTFTSKPFDGKGGLTPCCFIISAETQHLAETLAGCVVSILDWVYMETNRPDPIARHEVSAIIGTIRNRCLLLTYELAIEVFADVSWPVNSHIDATHSVIRWDTRLGFDEEKIAAIEQWVPRRW